MDVGGTHTDACAVTGERSVRGKALTTYDDFSRGVLDALAVVAEGFHTSREALLARTRLLVNGTTVVTNAITTLRGSRVGVLVTAGVRDTFRIAGGPRRAEFDDHRQENAPDLVRREDIIEIDERLGWDGAVLAPLPVAAVQDAAKRLVDEHGVDALSVCFLSSFTNPDHELEAEACIRQLYPDLFVSLSHRCVPVVGETRRFTTAVLNSFVQARARRYLERVHASLREHGLRGGLVFFQGLGGGISLERAREFPLALLGSGPAGGAIGARELARRLAIERVLVGDMGGTSFDTGIIVGHEIGLEKNLQIDLLQTGVSVVDIVSVGAGGGSIARVSESGIPQVGPQSAGSEPGPAAYGFGGEAPTVTDAMVQLGFIDPTRYLGGRLPLHPDRAREALDTTLATPFGWSTDRAAAAVHDLVVENMANAVHEVSVGRGHDPRDFVFLAYGGMLPLFAAQIAARLQIPRALVPENSSVFSALGLLGADFVMRYDRTVAHELGAGDLDALQRVGDEMADEARTAMRAEGFADADIALRRSGDFRFLGQSYELTLPLPDLPLRVADIPALGERFFALYERTYGRGTAWKGVPVQLLNYTVTVTGRLERPTRPEAPLETGAPAPEPSGARRVYLPSRRERCEVPVYDDARVRPGMSVAGPAIVDAADTTIFVPPGARATRDALRNYVLTTLGAQT